MPSLRELERRSGQRAGRCLQLADADATARGADAASLRSCGCPFGAAVADHAPIRVDEMV